MGTTREQVLAFDERLNGEMRRFSHLAGLVHYFTKPCADRPPEAHPEFRASLQRVLGRIETEIDKLRQLHQQGCDLLGPWLGAPLTDLAPTTWDPREMARFRLLSGEPTESDMRLAAAALAREIEQERQG